MGAIMKPKIITDYEVLGKCAWCANKIRDDVPVYGFGIKFKPDVNLSEYEGNAIELPILVAQKNIPMVITAEGAEAKNDGNDALFMTCSAECGNKLRNILLQEKSLGDIFANISSLD